MPTASPDRLLRLAMRVVGVIFIAVIWPLTQVWPSGWSWDDGCASHYLPMILGIYATLGACLLWASRDPRGNLGLVWFTVWSSLVHAGIMAVQALGDHPMAGHLLGDVPALVLVAGLLGVPATRLRSTGSVLAAPQQATNGKAR